VQDLRQRVIGAPEISTDGFLSYHNAIRNAFMVLSQRRTNYFFVFRGGLNRQEVQHSVSRRTSTSVNAAAASG
jgi:hypothetical protein